MSCFCTCKNSNVINPIKVQSSSYNTVHLNNIIDSGNAEKISQKEINLVTKAISKTAKFDKFKNTNLEIKVLNKSKDRGIHKKLSPKKIEFNDPINSYQKPLYELHDKFMCFFCGGKKCAHENWKLHQNPALTGLHSDQITEDLFASQRISNRLIKEFKLIEQFKKQDIGLIINLQLQGEHPLCGDRLDPISGFSYDPQIFISENIKYRNPGWKDMSVPDSMNFMVNIIKDMSVTIKEDKKKVLIHCHAGYGRTGCVIACYMLYDSNMNLEEVIGKIRKKRGKCIQKKSQMDFCKRFSEYIRRARVIFTRHNQPIDNFIRNQNDLLFGTELNLNGNLPILLRKTFENIFKLYQESKIKLVDIYKEFYYTTGWSSESEYKLIEYKKEINSGNWENFDKIQDITTLVLLLFDWIEDSVDCMISPEKIMGIFTNHIKQKAFSKFVKTLNLANPTEKRDYFTKIKKNIRSLELEIISFLIDFLMKLSPTEKNREEIFFYERMKEKLILSFSGISSLSVNYKITDNQENFNKDQVPIEVKGLLDNFSLILDFLMNLESNSDGINENLIRMSSLVSSNPNSDYENRGRARMSLRDKRSNILFYSGEKSIEKMDEKEQVMIRIRDAIDRHFNEKLKRSYLNDECLNPKKNTSPSKSKENKNLFIRNEEIVESVLNELKEIVIKTPSTSPKFKKQSPSRKNLLNPRKSSDRDRVPRSFTKKDKSLPIIEESDSPIDLYKADFTSYIKNKYDFIDESHKKSIEKNNSHTEHPRSNLERVQFKARSSIQHSSIHASFSQYMYVNSKLRRNGNTHIEIDSNFQSRLPSS